MSVGVVVVAYGGADLLSLALEPLRDFPRVVVDNSSNADVRSVCDDHGAHYLTPGRNLGFGAGVNVGVSYLWQDGPTDVLVLNPDAILQPAGLAALRATLHEVPRAAVVSPSLTGSDGSPQRVLWNFPSPGAMWREAVGFGRVNDRKREWVTGAVMLIRAEAWEAVGPFDEQFFLYGEETDWQRRATDLGWHALHVEVATAKHIGAATSSDPLRREALFHAGTETYIRKWFGSGGWLSYRAAAILGATIRLLVLRGEQGKQARRRLMLYLRGPRRVARS